MKVFKLSTLLIIYLTRVLIKTKQNFLGSRQMHVQIRFSNQQNTQKGLETESSNVFNRTQSQSTFQRLFDFPLLAVKGKAMVLNIIPQKSSHESFPH